MAEMLSRTEELATVRRFEAAGFRAWPAASVHYDGTWLTRLTAGYPAKRLNSVNPLDPDDVRDLPQRIAQAERRFETCGRKLTFRLSPLAGRAISRHLDGEGWEHFSESLVMGLPLEGQEAVHGAIDQIPLKDLTRFVDAAVRTQRLDPALRAALSEVIGAIQPEVGLFVIEHQETAVASAICVHDGDLAGLFEIATDPAERGKGLGRRIVLSALKWARLRGARQAWLQVEADNRQALRLYGAIGFSEIYRYHYRRPAAA
jgi:ribosomal protein S18 acetylase RimI-like enzyme